MRLACTERGDGPPVLLLHGLFGQARNLATLQSRLAQTYRVAAVDLRNHGTSPHGRGMSYPTLANDVAETMDVIGMRACAVIGHSMGGKVAMRLALDSPSRITRLLVADIAPIAYPGVFAAYAAAMGAIPLTPGLTRAQADAALAETIADPGLRLFLLQGLRVGPSPAWSIGLPEITQALPDILDWPPTDARYPGPTLFVAGARSTYITAGSYPVIRTLFPAARFATIADAGHWLHVDNPSGFLSVVQDFLKEDQGLCPLTTLGASAPRPA
jgi:pimeloyl-ACP methyl ester carboxylesterase